MASFPIGVKSFTTKQDGSGNTINAAHINDLQDEVAAIEDGYVNGTARLNSSNSTVANLHVTGKSTFAGAVTWTGNSTFAAIQAQATTLASLQVSGASTLATLQVSGASTFDSRPVMPPAHAARVTLDANQDVVANTTSAASWTKQDYLINSSVHSTAANPSRLFPQSTGVWVFAATFEVASAFSASTGAISVVIEDSSAAILASATGPAVAGFGTSVPYAVTATGSKRFDALGATPWVRAVMLYRDASTNSLSTLSNFELRQL